MDAQSKLKIAKERVATDPQDSDLTGIAGFYERSLRRFKTVFMMLTLFPLYAIGSVVLGTAFAPSVWLFKQIFDWTAAWPLAARVVAWGAGLGTGFFLFGFSLLVVVPAMNFALRAYPKAGRGTYYSAKFLPWYIHNGLTYIARFLFIEFVTPTPFNVLFYRLMGMKVGRGTQINTSAISDAALIELGEKVTIGGSVTLCAHYGVGGFLVLSPVKIGDGATIGLRAIILGDVEVGAGARILPNSVLLPKTRVPAGETWGGVPARKIELERAA